MFAAHYNTGIWRSAANIVIVVILVLAISELMLRVPAMMGQDFAAPEIDLTRRHILALGNSLTNPHGVPEEETYTAHLQRLFDETTPETFRMVNLGVVGVSSSYVANRLPDNLARYRPDFAIVWAGLNIRPDLIGNHETRNFWSTERSIAASSEIVRSSRPGDRIAKWKCVTTSRASGLISSSLNQRMFTWIGKKSRNKI